MTGFFVKKTLCQKATIKLHSKRQQLSYTPVIKLLPDNFIKT
jgi:hypothetical protein